MNGDFAMSEPENTINYRKAGDHVDKYLAAVLTATDGALVPVLSLALFAAVVLLSITVRRNRKKQRKLDTENLYQSELLFALSDNGNAVFMMLDAKNLHVDSLSPNVEKLLGIPYEEAREDIRKVDRLVKSREMAPIFDQMLAIQPEQQIEWDRVYTHRKTGEDRWFHGTALCRKLRGRKKYLLILTDRTREKRANRTAEERANVTGSDNRLQEEFLNGISHDIRTSLNAIIGFAALANANVDNEEKVASCLSKIIASGNQLLGRVNKALGIGKEGNADPCDTQSKAEAPIPLRGIRAVSFRQGRFRNPAAFARGAGGGQPLAEESECPEPEERERSLDFRGKRLLLVEDNALNREIETEIFGRYGFEIDVAETGAAAAHKIFTSAPGDYDLVLMDIQMPVMDGYETTRRVRAMADPKRAEIPIVAMTANAFDEDRRAAARCGMNGFLSKPIDICEVERTLLEIFR